MLRSGCIGNRSLLDLSEAVPDGANLFSRQLREVFEDLSRDPEEINVCAPHTLLRHIVRDERLEAGAAMLVREGWLDKLSSKIFPRKKNRESLARQVRSLCKNALIVFNRGNVEDLRPDFYVHPWVEKPDSAVIAWNRLFSETGERIRGALHRGVPDSTMSHQDALWRSDVRNGQICAVKEERFR